MTQKFVKLAAELLFNFLLVLDKPDFFGHVLRSVIRYLNFLRSIFLQSILRNAHNWYQKKKIHLPDEPHRDVLEHVLWL